MPAVVPSLLQPRLSTGLSRNFVEFVAKATSWLKSLPYSPGLLGRYRAGLVPLLEDVVGERVQEIVGPRHALLLPELPQVGIVGHCPALAIGKQYASLLVLVVRDVRGDSRVSGRGRTPARLVGKH